MRLFELLDCPTHRLTDPKADVYRRVRLNVYIIELDEASLKHRF